MAKNGLVTLVCVICGARFFRAKNVAVKAKVCTPNSHVCQGARKNMPNGKEKYLSCGENCCRSQYKRGQSSQFMDGVLERTKYFDNAEELIRIFTFLEDAKPDIRMAIRLIGACGLRVSESALIRVGDCFLDDSVPHILASTLKRKGHPKRRVDLEPAFAAEFRAYVESLKKGQNQPVFEVPIRTLQENFKRMQVKAGCKVIRSIHSLRHTHVTRLSEAGYDPKYIQQRAGWSSIEMYKIYAHVADHTRKDLASKLPKM